MNMSVNEKALSEYACFFQDLLTSQGMTVINATMLGVLLNCLVFGTAVYMLDRFLRWAIVEGFRAFTIKSKNTFDDHMLQTNFPRYVAHIIPVTLIKLALPYLVYDFPETLGFFTTIINIYVIFLAVRLLRSILRSTKYYLRTKEEYADKPIESYVQVLMIILWAIGIILVLSQLFGTSIKEFALSLGAVSAVILLIFKDTILGFVASIQISVNDIVRIGDWITFSKYGADGYVTEINLATVRVQNFDNTYTTIPTYSLISDSFQNWRGMQESKGRRIKRSIFIKQSSIRFLNDEDIERLKKIQLISPYLEHRQKEVMRFNRTHQIDKSHIVNGRNQTNLGVFRNYATAYLNENELINQNLFLMVRHLAPTEHGIPLEIFCYTHHKQWEKYELIMADIFDHLIAAIEYFDLEIFELPSGKDVQRALRND